MPLGALSCPICYCEYDQEDHLPRIMPSCGHTICSRCLAVLLVNPESAKCPLDNNRFLLQQATIDAFPVNFIVRQLSEEKANKKLCELHNEKLRLVCLTDKTQICDECVFSGDHKGHEIKSVKKFQQEAFHKRKELEAMAKNLEKHHSEVKEVLEKRRNNMLEVIKEKFQTLRWLMSKKELELGFEVNSYFDVEMEKLNQKNKEITDPIKEAIKSIEEVDNVARSQELVSGIEQDLPEIERKISMETFDEQAQRLNKKFNGLSNSFHEQLASQIEMLTQLEFSVQDLEKIVESETEIEKEIMEVRCDKIPFGRLRKSFRLEIKDDWLVVTTGNHSEQCTYNDNVLNIDWKGLDKVWLKLGKSDDMEDCLQALTYIWKRVNHVTCMKVDFNYKDISDKELAGVFSMIFFKAPELQGISVDLCDCKVGDQSLLPFLGDILPHMSKLKSVALNLNSTMITDKTVEIFARNVQPMLRSLESFDLRLWETKVTDRSMVQLFSKMMERVKRFVLDLGYTGITNDSIHTLAQVTLPSMKVLEEFKLGLSKTCVSDESVGHLFIRMDTAKHFLLYLHGTNITDKSLEMFAKKTLPSLRMIEVFEMRLGETKVSDQSVMRLFNNMESVRKFVLKLQSTSVTDRTAETFLRVALPVMKGLEEFEMDVSNTEVSEKYSAQLMSIKDKLSEQFLSI